MNSRSEPANIEFTRNSQGATLKCMHVIDRFQASVPHSQPGQGFVFTLAEREKLKTMTCDLKVRETFYFCFCRASEAAKYKQSAMKRFRYQGGEIGFHCRQPFLPLSARVPSLSRACFCRCCRMNFSLEFCRQFDSDLFLWNDVFCI